MRWMSWMAHDEPERRFDEWTTLCGCPECGEALAREAVLRPRLLICLETNADRILVTAERLNEARSEGEEAASLCYVEEDWVRETRVVEGQLPGTLSWWSLRLDREMREQSRVAASNSLRGNVSLDQAPGPGLEITSREPPR